MPDKKRRKIMLVDDNQTLLNMGKSLLKGIYEVYALPSAERLFKFLENVKPDVILLDIEMPEMNGFEVLRILKDDRRYAGIPVVFVTSHSEEISMEKAAEAGAVDFVTKPFSSSELIGCIEKHLIKPVCKKY